MAAVDAMPSESAVRSAETGPDGAEAPLDGLDLALVLGPEVEGFAQPPRALS